jgi:hypothetical protein
MHRESIGSGKGHLHPTRQFLNVHALLSGEFDRDRPFALGRAVRKFVKTEDGEKHFFFTSSFGYT